MIWSNLVSSIDPYVPGEQSPKTLVKLNTNENPYPPSPMVLSAIRSASGHLLRRYPDPESLELKEAIASVLQFSVNNIFVGNGGDEILAHSFLAFCNRNEPIGLADISYGLYPVYASLYRVPVHTIPLNDDYQLCIDKFCEFNGPVLIANPNAPTSFAIGINEIERLVKSKPNRAVIIDETYIAFGAESALPLIRKYDNLLLIRTFSKSHALAGLRVGYALGAPNMIEALKRIKNCFNSYPVDRLAQAGAAAAILDTAYYEQTTKKIMHTRAKSIETLRNIGFDCPDAKANFLFVKSTQEPAKEIYQRLRESGILIRYFDSPRLHDRLRITIGTNTEMETLFDALKK